MNILITGIHGFVGTNLVMSLKDKYHLNGLDIIAPHKEGVNKTHSWDDLNDGFSEIPHTIIHLAGKAHDIRNTTEQQAYYDINVGLTKQIFDHFLQSNTRKFIFFSSVKAVADSVEQEQLTEDELPHPQTPYGKSKLEAEKYILNQSVPENKKVYILRPCMIHGPGNKGNLNLLYKLVKKGIPWPLGAFENKRSFTSIDNLIFVINQIIEKNIEPGVYNMADDAAISTNRLIEIISTSRGKRARVWKMNRKLISITAQIGDLLHLPLNAERLKKLTESYMVSNQKLKNALDIEKMPVSAEDGMKKTLNSFIK